ncbi:unnamed protein product [Meloidogyne enterolobii]|uniref:Uncharacterized protein n=1 Tax=Meloidogyne enterolobii TaxID=390850 RepID=A0ACB0ZNF4_MELEN
MEYSQNAKNLSYTPSVYSTSHLYHTNSSQKFNISCLSQPFPHIPNSQNVYILPLLIHFYTSPSYPFIPDMFSQLLVILFQESFEIWDKMSQNKKFLIF